MFDKFVRNTTVLPSVIEVTERRAPTDDSIRLADEMQAKLLRNLVVARIDTDNIVNGVSVEIKDHFGRQRIFVGFMLNGKKYDVDITTDSREFSDRLQVVNRLIRLIADAITNDILVRCNLDKFATLLERSK